MDFRKLSDREKILLSILGIIFFGYVYYQFVFCKLGDIVEKKAQEENRLETEYNTTIQTINSMPVQESKLKILKAKIDDEAYPFYPVLSQEHVIAQIDELMKECNIDGGVTFEEEKTDKIPFLKKSEKDKGLAESSFKEKADKYSSKYGDKTESIQEKNENSKSTNSNTSQNNSTENNSNNNSNSENANKEVASNGEIVPNLQGKIQFYGTYSNVIKFIQEIQKSRYKLVTYGIGMEINDDKRVKGELGIVVYALPKITDETAEYLKWNFNNQYGKNEPFQTGDGAGTAFENQSKYEDFVIGVKSFSSELPTVVIGRADNDMKTTYVYADGNNEQNAEIIFNQKDDKIYYKYKTSNGSMPVDYSGDGCEFVTKTDNIVLNINSQKRESSNDKSSLNLKVVNNTDRSVIVKVNNDDSNIPRVKVEHDDSNVTVIEK